mmetsp:Transcript_20438/g.48717  ORF Transcript_20438/g.48717 Transcript_20438/m.48717 type:complete len:313 (+) Transcript_20438:1186-2124(+)
MQATAVEAQPAVGGLGRHVRMRDQQAGRAGLVRAAAQQGQHLGGMAGVEVASGFVRQHQARAVHQRAGDRHPLQLPARQLARHPCRQPAKVDRFQHGRHAAVVALAQQPQRQGDVVGHAEVGQQMEGLEDEAQVAAAQRGAGLVVQRAEGLPGQRDVAGVGLVQPGQAVQQRGLAAAGFAQQRDDLAGGEVQVDAGEDGRVAVGLGQPAGAQHRGTVTGLGKAHASLSAGGRAARPCGADSLMPRRARASRSSTSAWALALRSSWAARRSTSAHSAGSMRSGKAFLSGLAIAGRQAPGPASVAGLMRTASRC